MRYEVRVAGKRFQSDNVRILLKRAVEAKRKRQLRSGSSASENQSEFATPGRALFLCEMKVRA